MRSNNSLFPENLIFEEKNYRTNSINPAISIICSADKAFRNKKTGIPRQILKDSCQVASSGIEPESGASEALILSIVLRGQL
jgi:hypothetical protein